MDLFTAPTVRFSVLYCYRDSVMIVVRFSLNGNEASDGVGFVQKAREGFVCQLSFSIFDPFDWKNYGVEVPAQQVEVHEDESLADIVREPLAKRFVGGAMGRKRRRD